MKRLLATYSAAAAIVFSCSGPVSSSPTPTVLKTQVLIGSFGPKWSFDISFVDSAKGLYYLADRDSAALDVVSIKSSTVLYKITGFTGNKGASKISGPQGVVSIPGTDTIYVGDVNSVKVVDLAQRRIVDSIQTTDTGLRSDEGCYDPADKVMMFTEGNDPTPNSAFISTTKHNLIGKVRYPGADGAEQCSYDATTKSFYQSIPSTPTNPGGEIDVIRAADVVSGDAKVSKVYPLDSCTPTGNVFGPTIHGRPELLISCDASDGKAGAPIFVVIMNVLDGSIVTKISQVGAADQVAYNAKTNKYYLAARNYYASGQNQVGPRTPVLGVIDGGSDSTPPAWVENVPTCNPSGAAGCNDFAHSVATDAVTGRTFVPVASDTVSVVNVYGPADMP